MDRLRTSAKDSTQEPAESSAKKSGEDVIGEPLPVRIDLSYRDKVNLDIDVKDIHQKTVLQGSIRWKNSRELEMSFPVLGFQSVQISKTESKKSSGGTLWKCFAGISVAYRLEACLSSKSFVIRIYPETSFVPEFVLSGDRFEFSAPVTLEVEPPTTFTLDEAVQKAILRSWSSRIQVEDLFQSREKLRESYLNLAPHFGYRSIASLASVSPWFMVATIGDFLPFLLPTRWLEIFERKNLNQAEELSLSIFHADLATEVETLAYLMERDINIRAFYQALGIEIEALAVHFGDDEKSGRMKNILTNIVDLLKLSVMDFEPVIAVERARLSDLLGFNAGNVVRRIELGFEAEPIDVAALLDDGEKMATQALQRSLELRQMQYLIKVAQLHKKTFYFNWIDPDVGSRLSGSLGLMPLMEISASSIRQLEVKRDKVKSQVFGKVFWYIGERNHAVKSSKVARKVYDFEKQRLFEMIEKLQKIGATSSEDPELLELELRDRVNSYVSSQIKVETLIANYRTFQSRLNRMLLTGYYAQVRPLEVDI